MKKNLRIVSVAAAALLAVAPVATSVVPTVGANVVQAKNQDAKKAEVISIVDSSNKELNKDNNSNSYNATLNLSSNENSVSAIVNKIIASYKFKIGSAAARPLNTGLVETAVRSSLATNQVSVDAQGNFTSPATSFVISIPVTNGDNTAATLNLMVTPYDASSDTSLNPTITYNGKKYDKSATLDTAAMNNASFTTVALNGTVNTAAIQQAFTATAAGNSNMPLSVTVDTSKVNTAVGGTYPVTVSATDGNTKRTVTLTFNVQVGVAGAKYQTATAANNADIPVYRISGNAVSQTTTTIKSGTQVPTFGTVTVGNTSYTRINSASSNEFVLTSVFNATPSTPSDSNTQTETVMVDSRAYDKSGNYLGHMYYAYDSIEIVPTVVTINGKTYYKVANKDEYVRVTNITGNKRTLTHNAYIYWSSYRRTPGTGKMYKGQTVTTYGPAMRFKNGKKYYRIEGCRNNNKRYIKAANLSAAQ